MVSSPAANGGSSTRILVVDDHPDVAKVLGIMLRRCGHDVEVLIDGTECLSHIDSFQPDIVLLDVVMPKISGYDLARQIRARPESQGVIIIAISGYCGPECAQLSFDAGCDRHLVKPVNLAELESAIGGEIERRLVFQSGLCGK